MWAFKLEERFKFTGRVIKSIALSFLVNNYVTRLVDQTCGTVTDSVQAFDRLRNLLTQIVAWLELSYMLVENLHYVSLSTEKRHVLGWVVERPRGTLHSMVFLLLQVFAE